MKTQEIKKMPINNWIKHVIGGHRLPDSLFLKYNLNEQKECINLIRRKQTPLYFALANRYCLDIIRIFVYFDQESLKNTQAIFNSYSYSSNILYYIPQKEVLTYLISLFKANNIPYDPVYALKTVVKFCNDNDAIYFINIHSHMLNQGLCQLLLDISCELTIRPQCILKLVSLGAQLQDYHFKKMSTFLNNPSGVFETDKEAGIRDQDLLNLLDLMAKTNIPVPISSSYFANSGETASKKLMVRHLPIDIGNPQTLLDLEYTIVNVAHYEKSAVIEEDRFLLDSIQILFNRFPQYRPVNPEEFEFVAFCSIRLQHPLIHTLLERVLTLTHIFDCLESWPEKMKFANPQGNTLADMIAFYSRDPKLLAKLGNVFSINQLNRTPSHYAMFSNSALSELHWVNPIESQGENGFKYGLYQRLFHHLLISQTDNHLADIKQVAAMRNVKEDIKDFYYRYFTNFRNTRLSVQLDALGSLSAYKNINFAFDADREDVIGCTPLDYAGMLTDENQKNSILRQYSIFLYLWLLNLLVIPSDLIKLIVQYTESYEDSPENLVIRWAEKFVEKRSLFGAKIQSWLINPLQSQMDEKQKLIQNPDNIFLARVIMQVFNLSTCVGIVSSFNGSAIYARKRFRKEVDSSNSFTTTHNQWLLTQGKKRNRSEGNGPHCKVSRLKFD